MIEVTEYDLPDDRTLLVRVTDEGVIMDLYETDAPDKMRLVGTMGMMAEEWADWITEQTELRDTNFGD